MPSHPPKSITLFFQGNQQDWIALDQMEFGRPRTTLPVHLQGKITFGGKLDKISKDQKILLRPASGNQGHVREAAINSNEGGYCFENISPGSYQIEYGKNRTRWVDIHSDRFDIHLT